MSFRCDLFLGTFTTSLQKPKVAFENTCIKFQVSSSKWPKMTFKSSRKYSIYDLLSMAVFRLRAIFNFAVNYNVKFKFSFEKKVHLVKIKTSNLPTRFYGDISIRHLYRNVVAKT